MMRPIIATAWIHGPVPRHAIGTPAPRILGDSRRVKVNCIVHCAIDSMVQINFRQRRRERILGAKPECLVPIAPGICPSRTGAGEHLDLPARAVSPAFRPRFSDGRRQ